MRIAVFALIAGMTAAASPAAAEDLLITADGARPAVSVAAPIIPWEARWTGDAETPAPDAGDDAEITEATRDGPPTSIVPAAYAGDGEGRFGGLR